MALGLFPPPPLAGSMGQPWWAVREPVKLHSCSLWQPSVRTQKLLITGQKDAEGTGQE